VGGVGDGDAVEDTPRTQEVSLNRKDMRATPRHDAVAEVASRGAGVVRGAIEFLSDGVEVCRGTVQAI
jgi:hypothetical protein